MSTLSSAWKVGLRKQRERMSLLAEEEAKRKAWKGEVWCIAVTLFGWSAGVSRRGDREIGQVGNGQVETWMPGYFWVLYGGRW